MISNEAHGVIAITNIYCVACDIQTMRSHLKSTPLSTKKSD